MPPPAAGDGRHRPGAGFQRAGRADEFDAGTNAHHMPRQLALFDYGLQALLEPVRQLFHVGIVLIRHHMGKAGAHGGKLHRVGGQSGADPRIAGFAGGIVTAKRSATSCDSPRRKLERRLPQACRRRIYRGPDCGCGCSRRARSRSCVFRRSEGVYQYRGSACALFQGSRGSGSTMQELGQHRLHDDAGDVLAGQQFLKASIIDR